MHPELTYRFLETSRNCLVFLDKVDKTNSFYTVSNSLIDDILICLDKIRGLILDRDIPINLIEEFDKLYDDIKDYPLENLWGKNNVRIEEDFYLFSKDLLLLCDLINN